MAELTRKELILALAGVRECIDGNNGQNLVARFGGVDLSGLDLSMLNLANVDFSRANLKGCNFRDAYMAGAQLLDANASGADFSEACLEEVTANSLVAVRAVFRGTFGCGFEAEDADFTSADFTDAKLCYARLRRAKFRYAKLIDVSMDGADVLGCDWIGAAVDGGDWSDLAEWQGQPPQLPFPLPNGGRPRNREVA